MPLRCTTDVPVRTSRLTMSISISPSVIVGTIWPIASRGPSGDDDGTGEELLGRERHRQDVIHPEVECSQLGLQVAATRQAECGRDASRQGIRRAQPLEERRAVVVVHVDDGQVRAPFRQDAFGLVEAPGGPNDEQAVVQGQLDQVHDEREVVEHERATRFARQTFRVTGVHDDQSTQLATRERSFRSAHRRGA